MFLTTATGMRLFYDQTGAGEDLILIGGLTTHHLIWDPILPELTKNFRVLRFDNRASGQSTGPNKSFTIEDMAEDVIALMDELKIKQAYIAGHSMGGAILQQLLITHPARIKKAIICASFAKAPLISSIHIHTSSHLRKEGLPEPLILETVIPWIFGSAFIRDEKYLRELINTLMLDPYPQSAADYDAQANAIAHFNLRGKLKNISVKTLIVAGGQDKLTPLSCSKYLHRSIPNSELAVIKKSGHMLQLEFPAELADLITKFCAT